ncbi:hypothetical protein K440DRAFT_291437 [Wilcoxina mikolae CBS 423.85]|nr:hypothetical protein K440DRAFT_291437 [Wilcoxina mikolae CBS 423.85]
MIDELNMISAEDQAERIRMWVDYGTYGFARLGDVRPWAHLKHSMANNRTQPDEGVSRLLERIDLLFITEPLTGIRTHGSYGTGARSGSNKATAPNPDRKRPASADPGGSKRHKGPNKNQEQPGDGDKSSNKLKPSPRKQGLYECHVPNDSCKDLRFDSLDGLLQHLAGSHMDQCCPVCQENISLIEGRWVLSHGRGIRVEADINIFFLNNANMKYAPWMYHRQPD